MSDCNINNDNYIHPSKDIQFKSGKELRDKKIVLCITGSVSSYRAIDLARLLIRHGAEVYTVMTKAVSKQLLHPEMMKWATGNEVISKLTGNLEHIIVADYYRSDLILVYPCTANTIGKFANGIDDTAVSSVLSVGFGAKIPIMISPAMHQAMYDNPIIIENMSRLKKIGIKFIDPTIQEGKAKLADPQKVADIVLELFNSQKPLHGKRILVTAGSTIEYLDPIRVITNPSSGKMGSIIAEEASKMGATTTLIIGHSTYNPTDGISKKIEIKTTHDMHNAIVNEMRNTKYHILVHAAAVTDYFPEVVNIKKLPSREGKITVKLIPTIKIIDRIKEIDNEILLVGFKAEHNRTEQELVEIAFKKLKESKSDIVVANDVSIKNGGIGSDFNEVIIIDEEKKYKKCPLQSKRDIAKEILQVIIEKIQK